jgi:hypothetical protein
MRQQAEAATADLSVLPTRVRFSTSGSIADTAIPQAIKILNTEIVAVVRFPHGGAVFLEEILSCCDGRFGPG